MCPKAAPSADAISGKGMFFILVHSTGTRIGAFPEVNRMELTVRKPTFGWMHVFPAAKMCANFRKVICGRRTHLKLILL